MRKADIQELLNEFSHKKTNASKKKSRFRRFFRLPKFPGRKAVKRLFRSLGALVALGGAFVVVWFYTRILPEIPRLSVDELDSLFSQTTVVTDNDGEELYKFFEQYRKNVSYDEISPHMIDAIVAVEDKSFWTNPGIDLYGIVRAAYVSVNAKLFGGSVQGASTITQQSVKNLLLTNDRNITRKVKEIVLALQLDNVLQRDIAATYTSLSSEEVNQLKKQRIIELYLNYIFMGNNAYGIESASNIYFDKTASELNIIESAVLASIPKSPTRYSPYRNTGFLMGEVEVSRNGTVLEELPEGLMDEINALIIQTIERTPFSRGKFVSQVQNALDLSISYNNTSYDIAYRRGRKDHVLNRMYDERYISQNQLKDSFVQGLDMEFTRSNITDMKAPHFIFYVQEYLTTQPEFAELGIDQESLLEGGYTIVTTLDQDIQEIAETAIRKYMPLVQQKGGSNRSMVYVDSTNGDILAYVGSADYNNEAIEGENDMVSNARRQPGSAVKPFVYANYLQKNPSTIDTPIFDIPLSLGGLSPNNADGAFDGLVSLREALGGSRNIPAVKAYVAGGQEQVIKPFLKNLGMTSLQDNRSYGYSLSLGAGEITMLELTKAYMHLSSQGRPALINPIVEIRDPQGNILYQKEAQKVEQTILVPEVAYLIWNILSDTANMPAGWIRLFNVSGLNIAIKSGTSNKVLANGRKVAGDAWLAAYTPSKVAMFWAGNTDGSGMNGDAYGGSLNGPVMQEFYGALRDQGFIDREQMPIAPGVRRVAISKISGRLASEDTPDEYTIESLAYRAPTAVDAGMTPFEFDVLCGGMVSEYTPRDEIGQGYLITPTSIIPTTDLNNVRTWWNQGNELAGSGQVVTGTGKITYNYTNFFIETPTEPCEARIPKIDENIVVSFGSPENAQSVGSDFDIQYAVSSPHTITTVKVLVNGEVIEEISHNQTLFSHTDTINLSPEIEGNITLELLVLADNGFSNSVRRVVRITDDMTAPYLQEDSVQVQQLANGQYRVELSFADDQSVMENGQLRFGENTERIHRFIGASTRVTVDTLEPLGYIIYDSAGNSAAGVVPIAEYFQEATVPSVQQNDEEVQDLDQATQQQAEQLLQQLLGDIESIE